MNSIAESVERRIEIHCGARDSNLGAGFLFIDMY